jgi:thioredoxin reductase (NADPH)
VTGADTSPVDVTVIGGGPTGLAAAYYAGHRAASVRIVESLGQLGGQTAAIYPEKHIHDVAGHYTVNGQQLVDVCVRQALQFHPDVLLGDEAVGLRSVGVEGEPTFELTTASGRRLLSRAVVISAGHGAFEPRKLGVWDIGDWEGRGVHYFVRDRSAFEGKRLVIVGGGDSALDWTLGLSGRALPPVVLIHRRDRFRAVESSVEQARRLESAGHVVIRNPAEVRHLHGNGKLEAVTVENTSTGAHERFECDALITLLGFHAHLGPMADTWGLDLYGRKQIRIDPVTCETSLQGVYAAGDIAGHDGKITLITTGFAEAAVAANNAVAKLRGERLQPNYSTEGRG